MTIAKRTAAMHTIAAHILSRGVVAVSPVSLYECLGLVCLGATKNSETHKQICDLLRLDEEDEDAFLLESHTMRAALLSEHAGVSLEMGNSLWGEDMKPAYIELCAKRMAAEVRPLASCSVINAWVAERTKGMITKLLQTDPPGPVVLINVLAVKATWTHSFDLDKTRVAKFYRGVDKDGDPSDAVECDMMTGTEEFHYACLSNKDDGAQIIELRYGPKHAPGVPWTTTNMNPFVAYVLLPGVLGSVEKLLENVVRNAEVFDDIVDSMESEKVRLELPKFTVDSNTSVKDGLISLGMENAFSGIAAFDRLTDADVFVKDVVHAVKIKVDEAGTEAAAATAAVFQTKGGGGRKKDYIDMCVNRKFIFLLKCKATKALLFAAVVTNPRPLTE